MKNKLKNRSQGSNLPLMERTETPGVTPRKVHPPQPWALASHPHSLTQIPRSTFHTLHTLPGRRKSQQLHTQGQECVFWIYQDQDSSIVLFHKHIPSWHHRLIPRTSTASHCQTPQAWKGEKREKSSLAISHVSSEALAWSAAVRTGTQQMWKKSRNENIFKS